MQYTKGITIGVIILILELLLLTNAALLFPLAQVSSVQTILLIYAVIHLFAMVLLLTVKLKTEIFNLDSLHGLFQFGLGFLITGVFLVVTIPAQIAASFDPLSGIVTVSFIGSLVYIFIKAFIEEFFFRDTLEEVVGRFGQAALFGLFHLAVLSIGGASAISIATGAIFLAFLGLVWSYMKDFKLFGILGATGSHTAWNAYAVGLLKGVFGS